MILSNPVAGFRRDLKTPANGSVTFANDPYHSYELKVGKEGFAGNLQTLSLRSNIPQAVDVTLSVVQTCTEVTVSAESRTLVDP